MSAAFGPLLAAAATAHPVTDASAPPACPVAVGRTLPALRAADVSLARGDARQANAKLDLALATLGTAFRRRGLLDDTGLKLVLAQTEERKGKLSKAAGIKRRVLESRLRLCGYTPRR